MSWYIIKKKSETRWTAYNVSKAQVKRLKEGYEHKGPYKSLIAAVAAANSDDKVAKALDKEQSQ
jgi:hypothetical protein